VRLHREVNVEIPVHVTGEGGVQAQALGAEPGAADETATPEEASIPESQAIDEAATE
jgi:hypothetical protein